MTFNRKQTTRQITRQAVSSAHEERGGDNDGEDAVGAFDSQQAESDSQRHFTRLVGARFGGGEQKAVQGISHGRARQAEEVVII